MKKVAVAIHAFNDFNPNIIEGLKGLDYIHVDVMDGKFVNNTNLNLNAFKMLKKNTDIPIVAHLMVSDPFDYIEKIIDYIDIFLFHFESEGDKLAIINAVKKSGKKVGIALNPDTNITEITPYLDLIDLILVMSVYPGFSGQEFIPNMINKVNLLAEYKKSYKFEISIDGGINCENAGKLINVDILCSSSTILKAENPNNMIKLLKQSN